MLFRQVWLDGQRLIQGAVIAQKELLDGLIDAPFLETALSQMSDLTIAYRGELIGAAGVSRASGYRDFEDGRRVALSRAVVVRR